MAKHMKTAEQKGWITHRNKKDTKSHGMKDASRKNVASLKPPKRKGAEKRLMTSDEKKPQRSGPDVGSETWLTSGLHSETNGSMCVQS